MSAKPSAISTFQPLNRPVFDFGVLRSPLAFAAQSRNHDRNRRERGKPVLICGTKTQFTRLAALNHGEESSGDNTKDHMPNETHPLGITDL